MQHKDGPIEAPGRPKTLRVPCRSAHRAGPGRRITSASTLNVIEEMTRTLASFACTSCGHETPKWMGRCPGCGEWNSLQEEPAGGQGDSGTGRRDGRFGKRPKAKPRKPVPLEEVEALAVERVKTGSGELDRVLGGGIVPGSIVLIGGSPGIGKSTLMSATLASVQDAGRSSLYVSGEESAAQVRLRAERLGAGALAVPVLAETSLETVLATLEVERPEVCVVDSVQTLHSEALTGAAGSVGQVREVAARLERLAREVGTAVILVGHVTKDGTLAGPRVLEHAVDCVLQFEGEPQRTYRTLRALKNRFGSTNEIGIFEMRSGGLTEVADPSERFVREAEPVAGSCLLCAMEGSRPLLVEVQALVAPSDVVPPRRVANGVDRNRLSLVLAVLGRGGGPSLGSFDVFVSVAGGVRIEEPGADLAIALAIASASTREPVSSGRVPTGCFGEIGLTGELRYVAHPERRLEEAARFGLERVLAPSRSLEEAAPRGAIAVSTVREALAAAFEYGRPAQRAA
jgi:DNA repair protein RadA/Sms